MYGPKGMNPPTMYAPAIVNPLSSVLSVSQFLLGRLKLLQNFGAGETPKSQKGLIHTIFLCPPIR